MAKRTIATCKRCGTQFSVSGEITGCVNCHHPELKVEPEPENWLELTELAKDLSEEDVDAWLADLEKDNELTKKFISDLEAEFEVDQAMRELFGDEPDANELVRPGAKDWSKAPHDPACCCDKCAPTKEVRDRKAAEFEAQQMKEPSRQGHCRTCANWRKETPQEGICWRGAVFESPPKYWWMTCTYYRENKLYSEQQLEIRERRKAHSSIIRAMERSRA